LAENKEEEKEEKKLEEFEFTPKEIIMFYV
jgi:hypothetical protein